MSSIYPGFDLNQILLRTLLLLKISKEIYHLLERIEQQRDSRRTNCTALVEQKLREQTPFYGSHTLEP